MYYFISEHFYLSLNHVENKELDSDYLKFELMKLKYEE